MRLTNTIRDAFVNAAINDVPSVDYESMMPKLALDDAIAQMPAAVQKVYKSNPEYFERAGKDPRGPQGEYLGYYYGPWGNNQPSREVCEKLAEMDSLHQIQCTEQQKLRTSIKAVAYSVSTRKALVELLPEFEKYLPEVGEPVSRFVPAVANVIAEFAKAGWPKDQESKAA